MIIPSYSFLFIFLLRVTPTANRNTYSVAKIVGHVPRVEALHASTLGWGNATPTELPGVRTINYGITAHGRRACTVNNGITIHNPRLRTIHNGLTIHRPRVRANHNGLTIHGHRVHKQQQLCRSCQGCAPATMDKPNMHIGKARRLKRVYRSHCCLRRAPLTFLKGLQTHDWHALKRGEARCELPPF